MVIEVIGDIFSAKFRNAIICHQVNACGKMGSGIAKEIRSRYPNVYGQYKNDFEDGIVVLGYVSFVDIGDNLIANLCAQEKYGTNKRHTDYDALYICLMNVLKYAKDHNKKVVLPYKIGCGLGGGNWKVVMEMIEEMFGHEDVLVLIYNKEGVVEKENGTPNPFNLQHFKQDGEPNF